MRTIRCAEPDRPRTAQDHTLCLEERAMGWTLIIWFVITGAIGTALVWRIFRPARGTGLPGSSSLDAGTWSGDSGHHHHEGYSGGHSGGHHGGSFGGGHFGGHHG